MEKANKAALRGRIALYGGSFDPVHCAHLKVAHCALEQTKLDRVIFIPASQSPLKQRPFSRDADRLHMLQLALGDQIKFELDTYEIEKSGTNYTIDTVDHFQTLYRNSDLHWIIGEDQFNQLDKWYCINELVNKVIFLVCPRYSSNFRSVNLIDGLRYRVLKTEIMTESSTEIRERVGKGLSLSGLVPTSVEAFIYEKGLYKK